MDGSDNSKLSDDDKLSDINKSQEDNNGETDNASMVSSEEDQMLYMHEGSHADGEYEMVEQPKYLFSIKNEDTEKRFIVS